MRNDALRCTIRSAFLGAAFLSFNPSSSLICGISTLFPNARNFAKMPEMSLSSDEDYMRKAIAQATLAGEKGEVPIGAVLVHQSGEILASGHNQVEMMKDCTRHAEMNCLQSAMALQSRWRLTDTVMYSTLEPCPMCLSAIALARVRRLVYGAPDLRLGACGTWVDLTSCRHPFHNFDEVKGGVLSTECGKMIRDFFRERRTEPPRYKP